MSNSDDILMRRRRQLRALLADWMDLGGKIDDAEKRLARVRRQWLDGYHEIDDALDEIS